MCTMSTMVVPPGSTTGPKRKRKPSTSESGFRVRADWSGFSLPLVIIINCLQAGGNNALVSAGVLFTAS